MYSPSEHYACIQKNNTDLLQRVSISNLEPYLVIERRCESGENDDFGTFVSAWTCHNLLIWIYQGNISRSFPLVGTLVKEMFKNHKQQKMEYPSNAPPKTRLYHYIPAIFAGIFLMSIIPHYIHGITEKPFPTSLLSLPAKDYHRQSSMFYGRLLIFWSVSLSFILPKSVCVQNGSGSLLLRVEWRCPFTELIILFRI